MPGPNPAVAQYKANTGPGQVQIQTLSTQFNNPTIAARTLGAFCTLSDFAVIHNDVIVTDTQGNSYTKVDQQNTNPSGGAASLISFYTPNIPGDGGGTPATLTQGFSINGDIEDFLANFIFELSSVTANPLIGFKGNTQNALAPGTNNVNSGAAVSVLSNQLPAIMVACAFNTSSSGSHPTPTVGTGMNLLTSDWGFGGAALACFAYQLITVAGNYQAVFNQASSATEDMCCSMYIFQGATIVSPPTSYYVGSDYAM